MPSGVSDSHIKNHSTYYFLQEVFLKTNLPGGTSAVPKYKGHLLLDIWRGTGGLPMGEKFLRYQSLSTLSWCSVPKNLLLL